MEIIFTFLPSATAFNVAVIALWLISALSDYIEFCYLWQLKEYRLDRMRDFFTTPQGRRYWLKYNISIRPLIALIAFFWPINDSVAAVKIALAILFSVDACRVAVFIARRHFRYPKPTAKSVSIILLSLLFGMAIIATSGDWATIFLVITARFFILGGFVIIVHQLTQRLKRIYIFRASRKLARYPRLLVIGVTGSYGKTAVKQFLSHILSAKYRVVKTPEHVNTEIGIATFILRTSFEQSDVFVVEMGAYKIGEIKQIADMVRPKIGILTAINEQHLSLFGSIKNTQTAKYELLRSLPPDGFAVVNADNPYCMEFVQTLCAPVATFGTEKEARPGILILESQQMKQGIQCTFEDNDQTVETVSAPVQGIHNCMNLAPCFLVAKRLGLSGNEIKKQLTTLAESSRSLRIISYGKTLVIDDSYNSNPDGFKSALHFMSSFPSERRRVVVTRGMYELGEKSDTLHEQIGEEIAFCADELVLVTRDFETQLRRGIGEKFRTSVTLKDTPDELLAYLRRLKDTPCVLLIENRVPYIVRKELNLIANQP